MVTYYNTIQICMNDLKKKEERGKIPEPFLKHYCVLQKHFPIVDARS